MPSRTLCNRPVKWDKHRSLPLHRKTSLYLQACQNNYNRLLLHLHRPTTPHRHNRLAISDLKEARNGPFPLVAMCVHRLLRSMTLSTSVQVITIFMPLMPLPASLCGPFPLAVRYTHPLLWPMALFTSARTITTSMPLMPLLASLCGPFAQARRCDHPLLWSMALF